MRRRSLLRRAIWAPVLYGPQFPPAPSFAVCDQTAVRPYSHAFDRLLPVLPIISVAPLNTPGRRQLVVSPRPPASDSRDLSGQRDGRCQTQRDPHHHHCDLRFRWLCCHSFRHLEMLSPPQVHPSPSHPAPSTPQGKGVRLYPPPSYPSRWCGTRPTWRLWERYVSAEAVSQTEF